MEGGEVKELTQQQAREFIAEKAGWCEFIEVNGSRLRAAPPGETLREDVPDYFNPEDREALFWMHKAEAVLHGHDWAKYTAFLERFTRGICAEISAPAPQRARAFCHVFGYEVNDK